MAETDALVCPCSERADAQPDGNSPLLSPIAAHDLDAVLSEMHDAAMAAGELALGFFRPGEETAARVDYKHGGSPVTEADLEVDRFLRDRFGATIPDAAWLSEETADDLSRLASDAVIIVDPIDGTRSFAQGDPRWAVSIGLVVGGRPVVGVLNVPAVGEVYTAVRGRGAQRNGQVLHASERGLLAGARLSAPAGFIKPLARAFPVDLEPKIPSLACRFAAVAAGDIDCAIASPNAHDWDLAAVDVILHEAGGCLTTLDGLPIVYNGRHLRHPTLCGAGMTLFPALLSAARRTLGGGA